jgi:hypothetical protein
VGGEDKAERAKRALNAMERVTVTLSLKHFILKQRALSLYRTAVRASRGDPQASFFTLSHLPTPVIPDSATRKETILWIRAEFERNKHIADLVGLNIPSLTCPPTLHSHSQDIIETKLRAGRRELERVFPYRSERNPPS